MLATVPINPAEEQAECPLCMEPFEVDDLTFFPCTCGYQICRFCWHRLRTDENGLCPACRKAYPEDPADFTPLSKEDFARIKADKRQKMLKKKMKITENRKVLENVRVMQRNLVFVLGLPNRLSDVDILRRHEYFGKFGKIVKLIVTHHNNAPTYVGTQASMPCAYVTYQKPDDALRAIQAVNNIVVDGRNIKASLGTTKYCANYMKNQPCVKVDCMYLHEIGDAEATFNKEDMQQGKHQEYERRLHDQLLSSSNVRKPTPSPTQQDAEDGCNQLGCEGQGGNGDGLMTELDGNGMQQTNGFSTQSIREEWPLLRSTSSPTSSSSSASSTDISTSILSSDSGLGIKDSVSTMVVTTHKSNKQKKKEERKMRSEKARRHSADVQENKASNRVTEEIKDKTHGERKTTMDNNIDTGSNVEANSGFGPPELLSNGLISKKEPDQNHNNLVDNNVAAATTYGSFNDFDSAWLLNDDAHIPDDLPAVHSSIDWEAAFGFKSVPNEVTDPGLDAIPDLVTEENFMIEEQESEKINLSLGIESSAKAAQSFREMIEKEQRKYEMDFETSGGSTSNDYFSDSSFGGHSSKETKSDDKSCGSNRGLGNGLTNGFGLKDMNGGYNLMNGFRSSANCVASNNNMIAQNFGSNGGPGNSVAGSSSAGLGLFSGMGMATRAQNGFMNNRGGNFMQGNHAGMNGMNFNGVSNNMTMQRNQKSSYNQILQNNRLSGCTNLMEDLHIGPILPQRSVLPPPGFSQSHSFNNQGSLLQGLQQRSSNNGNASKMFNSQSMNFHHQQSNSNSAFDWTLLDPAIVTASATSTNQNNDMFGSAQTPPPGFSMATASAQFDSNYLFNSFA